MKLKFLPLAALAVISAVSAPLFASDDARSLFDQAIKLKASAQAGTLQSATDSATRSAADGSPATAEELFGKSAALFESDASRDWHFWYEAGNARWWAGQADRAIIDYRRYIAHDYFRGEVWENLAEARRSAGTENPGREGFLFWPWPLWLASGAALFAGLFCCAFSLFLFFRRDGWRTASIALAILACCAALGGAGMFAGRGTVGVVVAETQGRKGDSSVYAPYPASPWKAGQEVVVTEVRDTWTRILVGNTVSWVPSDQIVSIEK